MQCARADLYEQGEMPSLKVTCQCQYYGPEDVPTGAWRWFEELLQRQAMLLVFGQEDSPQALFEEVDVLSKGEPMLRGSCFLSYCRQGIVNDFAMEIRSTEIQPSQT
mmetsp:Transcript_28666/g.67379  ORF Transcript_28666/g.67379 Transcript_28666/m.67379 type:complete len:107 (-) Transcript_28666:57-377(-)